MPERVPLRQLDDNLLSFYQLLSERFLEIFSAYNVNVVVFYVTGEYCRRGRLFHIDSYILIDLG